MAAPSTQKVQLERQGVRQNLATLVGDFARHGSQTAVVSWQALRQHRTSYQKLASLARRFAAELEQRGIVKGERVLLWGENSAEWVGAFFGCVLSGVLPVPLDYASSAEFASRVAADVSPRLAVVSREKLKALHSETPKLSLEDLSRTITYNEVGALPSLNPADPLQIIFTSGTTAEPKGIVHTHGNVLASLEPIEREMRKYLKYERIFHPIRILHTLPLSHVFGQFMGLWVPALMAAEVHYEARIVAADIAERIRRERISVLAAVPRLLDLLQSYLLERLPSLKERLRGARRMNAWQRWWSFRDVHRFLGLKFWAFVCGGASLSSSSEQFWSSLGFVVIQGYGMTETTALVSLNHPFRPAQGTIGQVLPGREVKLSDEGEVLVRGATISDAVWRNGRLERQSSPWLATGDLAEFDGSGNLRFRGRKKDVIVTSSGLNIYPEDLEAALLKQPGVRAAAVIEEQTARGPEPLAVFVSQPGSADAAGIVTGANRELADFQQIRHWLVWPEPDLPRTSTGKILRREVSRRVQSGEMSADGIKRSATDLSALDSLERVQLQAQLEMEYGVILDETALQGAKSSEEVERMIREAPAHLASPRGRQEHAYPHWPWYPPFEWIRGAFLNLIAMPFVWFLAAPRVLTKIRHWPTKPVLIVCNHITSYDAAFIFYALPAAMRWRTAVAMSGEMLLDMRRGRKQGNWFLNLLSPVAYLLITGLFSVFPLPQYSGFRRSFRHAGEAVDRGYNVIVFPEGRRSDDGTPQPFKSGAGLLWKELGTDALAVQLAGLGELKTQGGRWFRSGKIEVTVQAVLSADPARAPEELTEMLQRAVFRNENSAGNPTPERVEQFAADTLKERPAEDSDGQ